MTDYAEFVAKPTRPVLRYHGGKWMIAPWVLQHFPPHRVYPEPFGGAASILMRKQRAELVEMYNDLHSEIVDLFRVLRDPDKAARLAEAQRLTPFAREEFVLSYETADDPVEQARRTVVRSMQGFGSNSASGMKSGFRANGNRQTAHPASDWVNYSPAVAAFTDRLQGVVIENRMATDIIRQHDQPTTLHYCDPPYVHDTRSVHTTKTGKGYRYEMTDEDHRELADVLKRCSGMVSCLATRASCMRSYSMAGMSANAPPWLMAGRTAAQNEPKCFGSTMPAWKRWSAAEADCLRFTPDPPPPERQDNHMENATDDVAIHTLELCAGVGMLGEGVRAALEFLGIGHRTVCYVEREAAAAAQLVALMEAGAVDAAPVWSDMLTFDGRRFRGLVDCVAAGFPCQDLSVAGRRAGLNEGTRSGLFFRVLDIADDSGASFLVLENVAGIATATATVVDEEEGDLEERAAARVLGELADRGWNAEWITLSASDVGASHGRERWFCFAWRVADAEHAERWPLSAYRADSQQGDDGGWREAHGGARVAGAILADAIGGADERRGIARELAGACGLAQGQGNQWQWRGDAAHDCIEALGHANLERAHRSGPSRIEAGRAEPALAGGRVAHAEGDGRHQGWPESGWQQGRPDAAKCGGELAHARSARLARGGGRR